jgi:hypothetical protein
MKRQKMIETIAEYNTKKANQYALEACFKHREVGVYSNYFDSELKELIKDIEEENKA